MMKVNQLPLFFLLLAVCLNACKEDEPVSAGKYETGIFVVNEGPFGGAGTITWHDPESGETEQDIFGKANNGAVLGELVQSLYFHEGKAYICIGNSNKIVVADAATFEFLDTIVGLSKPRYFLPYGDHFAVVTQWGADGNTGTLAKIDLNTNEVLQTSALIGAGPDKIFQSAADEILVTNSGGFSTDSTVVLFQLSTFTEIARKVAGGKNPGMCARLKGGPANTYVLCKGSFNDPVPSGWLGLTSDNSAGQAIPFYSDDLCMAPDSSALYFTGGGFLYTLKNGTLSPLVPQQAYGLTCHPTSGDLICTDAKDFNSAGEAIIYKADGTRVASFPTGIAPGEIVIK